MNTMVMAIIGNALSSIHRGIIVLFENTIIKDRRYKVRGIIHNRGMLAMSAVRYEVTPSIRLDGTKESSNQ